MNDELHLTVIGTPAPQGSKRGFYNQRIGRVQMVESSKKVAPWRQDVKAAALNQIAETNWTHLVGAVGLTIAFYLPRPAGHFRTGKNAHLLRDAAPAYPGKKPDLDKLLRSTLDALGEAGVWRDDAQVVDVHAYKLYADARPPGARITISDLDLTHHQTTAPAGPPQLHIQQHRTPAADCPPREAPRETPA